MDIWIYKLDGTQIMPKIMKGHDDLSMGYIHYCKHYYALIVMKAKKWLDILSH